MTSTVANVHGFCAFPTLLRECISQPLTGIYTNCHSSKDKSCHQVSCQIVLAFNCNTPLRSEQPRVLKKASPGLSGASFQRSRHPRRIFRALPISGANSSASDTQSDPTGRKKFPHSQSRSYPASARSAIISGANRHRCGVRIQEAENAGVFMTPVAQNG